LINGDVESAAAGVLSSRWQPPADGLSWSDSRHQISDFGFLDGGREGEIHSGHRMRQCRQIHTVRSCQKRWQRRSKLLSVIFHSRLIRKTTSAHLPEILSGETTANLHGEGTHCMARRLHGVQSTFRSTGRHTRSSQNVRRAFSPSCSAACPPCPCQTTRTLS